MKRKLKSLAAAARAAVMAAAVLGPHTAAAAPDGGSTIASAAPAAVAPAADALNRLLVERGLAAHAFAAAPGATAPAIASRLRGSASEMVLTAMNYLGVPYRRGGDSAEHGFDCSGFTRQVFETGLGLLLPRRADEQAKAPGLVAVARPALEPGDLVFFNTLRRTFSHVGIYVGDGRFIHSPRPGGEVRVEDMRFPYWAKRYTGARRAEAMPERVAAEAESAAPTAPVAVDHTIY